MGRAAPGAPVSPISPAACGWPALADDLEALVAGRLLTLHWEHVRHRGALFPLTV
jgi:hypothetical protein